MAGTSAGASVVARAAGVRDEVVPAVYRAETRQVIDQPASTRMVDVPAVYVEHNTPRPSAAQTRHPLADRADIIVENFRPGTLERWGLDRATLSARNERLVHVAPIGSELRQARGFHPVAAQPSERLAHADAGVGAVVIGRVVDPVEVL